MSIKASPLKKPKRKPSPRTTLFLYVRAGGRCEFDGCNEYLLEHDPTETPGNFGEQAHIWGFKEKAARGAAPGRPAATEISEVGNLILLCPQCHHQIDAVAPEKYPVDVLRRTKADHEERVRSLTEIAKNRDTVPLVVKGLVAGRPVDVSDEEMQSAAAPSYVKRRQRVVIDLTGIPDSPDAEFWAVAVRAIDAKVQQFLRVQAEVGKILRVSVFGIGPIPLLVHLGARLNDKLDVDLFQLHRNPKDWTWKEGEGDVRFLTRRHSMHESGGDPALLVNLSGRNGVESIPQDVVLNGASVYELTLDGQDPHPLILNTRGDLDRFAREYIRALATIREAHPSASRIYLFPAVPAPVAIGLGLWRLPKVDPSLVVYDRDKRAGGFVPTLEIT